MQGNVGRLIALGCALAVMLGACAPKPDPEQPPAAATVGVLLTEDLPGDGWTGPLWDYTYLFEAGEGSRLPALGCRMPGVATSSSATGLVAHASAAWRLPDDSDTVVSSMANRYEGPDSLAQTLATMDRFVDKCATTGTDREVTLGGTEQAPVYDELDRDVTSERWRLRMAWTTLPDDVLVQVAVHWRDGHEPPVDAEDLLSQAVKRAETLPQTSPRPGFPPACEEC